MNIAISWDMIGVVLSFVETLAVVIALLYAGREVRNASRERDLSVVIQLQEMFEDVEARYERWYIFNKLPENTKDFSKEDYIVARNTWNRMNFLGVIEQHSFASRQLILELYSLQIVRLWGKLEPHIHYFRKERGNFAMHFEELAKDASKYRKRRYAEDSPRYYQSEWSSKNISTD